MMINKNHFIIIFFSFSFCINTYWEPYNPKVNDKVTVYADVSNSLEFKYSYPLYIHLSSNGKDYTTHLMSLDYVKQLSKWEYVFNISSNTYFQIDNNRSYIADKNWKDALIMISNKLDLFEEVDLALSKKKYNTTMLLLNNIIKKYQNNQISAKAEYMIAEIFLNDFKDYTMAVNYYQNIISNYPSDFEEVKKSIFTLAYIYANYLDYYTDAISLYKDFKNKYPDDDLITSIDYELNNLLKIDKEIESLLKSSK